MVNLIRTQLKECGAWDMISNLEIGDDWTFKITDEIVEKCESIWNTLGLLDGLNEPYKRTVCYNYTIMAIYLVKNEGLDKLKYGTLWLGPSIFPLIRCVANTERIANPKRLWEFCGEWLRERGDWIENMNKSGIDGEATALRALADVIEKIIKTGDGALSVQNSQN